MEKLFVVSAATFGVIASFIFCIVTLLLISFGTFTLTIAVGVTIIVNILLFLISPIITDLINKYLYHVTFLTPAEVEKAYPQVFATITPICQEYNFSFPKIGIIADGNPTAFTYGTGRGNARLVLTGGIFHFLNAEEIAAVVMHEMGHIVHRDFLVMMVATTCVQILYEIYAVLIRVKGKKTGSLKLIAILSYVLYLVGTYLLLFLSRTREYLADAFSAQRTSPVTLSNALVKIAYGIVAAEDTEESKRLLESTRHLGIVDVKNAKHVGLTSYISNRNPQAIAEVLVFDVVNPWAKIIELSSTHPLTGNRIEALRVIAEQRQIPFLCNVKEAIIRMNINYVKLWTGFLIDVIVTCIPLILGIGLIIATRDIVHGIAGYAIGLLFILIYKFPVGEPHETTIFTEMRNPYASPVKGKLIQLSGKVIGKGTPGYVFSEDMMFQDATGLTFLDYTSVLGFIGNFFFAITKVKNLIGQPSVAAGFFFRDMSSKVSLTVLKAQGEEIHSHPVLWKGVIAVVLLFVWAGLVLYRATL